MSEQFSSQRPLVWTLMMICLLFVAACSGNADAGKSEKTANADKATSSSSREASSEAEKSTLKTDKPYINRLLPEAQRIEQEYGIPVATTVAIAIHETGWGKYEIGQNNHFGLRCASNDCITLNHSGTAISYETCPDEAECFNMFAESLTELSQGKPSDLRVIYQNGYATSPKWVNKVRRIRRQVRRTLKAAGYQA